VNPRRVLKHAPERFFKSNAEYGELRRWEEARQQTPNGLELLYPLPPLDADALRRLAESAPAFNSLTMLPLL